MQPAHMPVSWKLVQRPADVLAGPGTLAQLGDLTAQLQARRVFLLSDAGLQAAGHVANACDSLSAAQVQFELFVGVEENPTDRCVERASVAARDFGPDLLVALGGGSVMDAAKGVNFLLSNGGQMEDYWGFGKAKAAMLPSVGIPCTAGTGSEAQSFALISRSQDHVKMACGDPKVRFTRVILDPHVLETVPRDVAAITGMDAVSHALESFVTRTRNPMSCALAAASWRALRRAFPLVLQGTPSIEDRGDMLSGAYLAGAAIECSMLGLAHAMANPLTARYDITHGVAIGIVLPAVLRFNATAVEENYRELVSVSAGETAAEQFDAGQEQVEQGEHDDRPNRGRDSAFARSPGSLDHRGSCTADSNRGIRRNLGDSGGIARNPV